MLIWSAYLLADWIAGLTIGSILSNQIKGTAKSGDIHAFWAPFLLLHLGGPDPITSVALEDNEFWVRHFFGLLLQVGSTTYIFIMSLPDNKLWLPTLLVLIAGIIKYAERNRAFYLASFDHFGDNWVRFQDANALPLPIQFLKKSNLATHSIVKKGICIFGAIKNLLLGPLMLSYDQQHVHMSIYESNSEEALRIIEIHLSLLYEVLHTKLPVVDSKFGYVGRFVNFGCVSGTCLWSFILLKKHYQLGEFEVWLTYGLLIGALALDFISIMILMMSSDWIFIAHFKNMESKFINRRRWSNSVSQLNFLTYHVNNYPLWFHKLVEFLRIKSLLDIIRRTQCVSSKNLREDQEWRFIVEELREKVPTGQEMRKKSSTGRYGILNGNRNLAWSIEKFEYMESLLMWHIATEKCFLQEEAPDYSSTSTSRNIDHRTICKLLSDYMFYLVVMEPTMMAAVSDNCKIVFESTSERAKKIVRIAADKLANRLMEHEGGCPWELMSKVWVELVCHAAINCKPIVHARQLSSGGQLLTLVWLLMNYLGLTPPKEW